MTTLAEWGDIKYKVFATGLNDMRRFKIPQCATEDADILEATTKYRNSLMDLKFKGKTASKADHENHCNIIQDIGYLLHLKGIHKRNF